MNQFFEGLTAPIQGAKLFLRIAGLWKWAIMPIVVYLLSVWVVYRFLEQPFWSWIRSFKEFFDGLGVWLNWLYYVFSFLSGFVVGLVLLYVVFLIVRVLASPFHSIIAEKVLSYQNVPIVSPTNIKEWTAHTVKMILSSLKDVYIFTIIGIGLFILSFVPGLNFVAAIGFMVVLAFDCTIFALESIGATSKERLAFIKKNIIAYIGFGLSLSVLFFIPFVNIILFPFAISGGSYLVSKLYKL